MRGCWQAKQASVKHTRLAAILCRETASCSISAAMRNPGYFPRAVSHSRVKMELKVERFNMKLIS